MRSRAVALVLSLIAIAAFGACGAGEASPGAEPTGSSTSSPFTIGAPPTGYELVTAGTGTQRQAWGDDSIGNDDPFTVLAPEGADATSRDIVVVSVTGFGGYEGGLGQASRGYGDPESFTLDGHDAMFGGSSVVDGVPTWADLVVVRGDDLAVRATARHATKDELIAVARSARPSADHLRAPDVPDPPNGLHVVGSVDANVVVGLWPDAAAHTDRVPGTAAAHGAGWVNGRQLIAAMTLPGQAAALDALGGFAVFRQREQFDTRSRTINGRPAIVIDSVRGDPNLDYGYRAVLTQTDWGDLVIVAAVTLPVPSSGTPADRVTTEQTLIDLAASVRRADDTTWEQFIETALGGPGLQPDAGAVEVTRGQAGGLEWLLQAREQGNTPTHPGIPTTGVQVDSCLKLSNRKRICAANLSGGLNGDHIFTELETVAGMQYDFDFPAFVIVSAPTPATQIRITTNAETKTGQLLPIPGTNLRAGVVVVERPGHAYCSREDLSSLGGGTGGTEPMRVDALNDAGEAVACFGLVPFREQ